MLSLLWEGLQLLLDCLVLDVFVDVVWDGHPLSNLPILNFYVRNITTFFGGK